MGVDLNANLGGASSANNVSKTVSETTLPPHIDVSDQNLYISRLEQIPYSDQVKGLYNSDFNRPTLPDPNTLAQQPFNQTGKNLILNDFSAAFQQQISNYANSFSPPLQQEQIQQLIDAYYASDEKTDPKTEEEADKLAQPSLKYTKQKYGLPPTWTPSSTKSTDWTSSGNIQVLPYGDEAKKNIIEEFNQVLLEQVGLLGKNSVPPLTQAQIQQLLAMANDPSLTQPTDLVILAKTASLTTLTKIQNKYALPDTWTPSATDSSAWTPVTVNGINPSAFSSAIVNSIQLAAINQATEQVEGLQAQVKDLPSSDPNKLSMMDFLKQIADALIALKQILNSSDSEDAKRAKIISDDKIALIREQSKTRQQQADNVKAQEQQTEKQKGIGIAMAVVGVLISVVAIVASVVSGGASLALIAVSVAMIAITIADSQTGFLTNGIQELTQKFAEFLATKIGDNASWAAPLIEALAMAVICILVCVITQGAGAGLAARAASSVGAALGKTVLTTVAELTIQMTVTCVMATNVFGACGGAIAIAAAQRTGMSQEEAQMIGEIIGMILGMIAVMIAAGKGTKEINADYLKSGASDTISGTVKTALKNAIGEERLNQITKIASSVQLGSQVAGGLAQGVVSTLNGVTLLRRAQLEKDLGQLEAQEIQLAALIKILDSMLAKLQTGLGSSTAFAKSVDDSLQNLWAGLSSNLSGMAQAAYRG